MNILANRVALVTGASRGIGRAIALALAEAGADVVIGYHKGDDESEAVRAEVVALGRRSIALAADLSDAQAAANLVRAGSDALGAIDIVVNNAGINPRKPLDQLRPADWDEMIRTNLSSAFYVTQAALPAMRERGWGRIIILSSVAAQLGGVIGPHYAASKAGLIGLMHGFASQLANEGITANAIAPALIATDMLKSNATITPNLIPLGRFGQPGEVASVAVMLASNGYVTGQTINVNGGWYMS